MNIKVDLSNFIFNSKRLALIHINFNSMKTVADVINHICTVFELNHAVDYRNYTLYEDIWYIPRKESSLIFKDMKGSLRLFDDDDESKERNCEALEISAVLSNNNEESTANSEKSVVNSDFNLSCVNNDKTQTHQQPKKSGYDIIVKYGKKNVSNKDDALNRINGNSAFDYNTVNHRSENVFPDNISSVYKKGNISTGNVAAIYTKELASSDNFEKLKPSNIPTIIVVRPKNNNILPNVSSVPENVSHSNDAVNEKESILLNDVSMEETVNNQVSCYNGIIIGEHSTPIDNSVTKEQREYNSTLDNSFISGGESMNTFVKRKRKRKHHNRKGKIRKSTVEEQINAIEENTTENERINCEKSSSNNFKNKKELLPQRVHKIFDSSEDENEATVDQSSLTVSDHMKFSSREIISSLYKDSKLSQDNSETITCVKDPSINSKDEKISKINSTRNSVKNNSNVLSSSEHQYSKLVPPVGYDFPEPTQEIKLKFQNLLALEFSYKPKIFKYRDNINGYNQDSLNNVNSLPRSFASRKEKSINRNEELMSLNTTIPNVSYNQNSLENCNSLSTSRKEEFNNKNGDVFNVTNSIGKDIYNQDSLDIWNSLPTSFASKKEKSFNRNKEVLSKKNSICNDESTVDNCLGPIINETRKDDVNTTVQEENSLTRPAGFVGAKAPKRNKRYIQSIGNTLSLLKGINNSVSKPKKNNSNENSPKYNSSPKIHTTELSFKRNNNSPSISQQSNDYLVLNNEKNTNAKDENGSLNKMHCQEQMYGKESSSPVNNGTRIISDTTNNSAINEAKVECSGSNSENVEEKSTEDSVICNTTYPNTTAEITVLKDTRQQGYSSTYMEKLKSCNISFESYPLLQTLPNAGDIIATKLLTTDESLCPSYSKYRPAKVISVDGLTLNLQFLDNNDVEIINNEENIVEIKDDERVIVDWRDLQSTRLMFP